MVRVFDFPLRICPGRLSSLRGGGGRGPGQEVLGRHLAGHVARRAFGLDPLAKVWPSASFQEGSSAPVQSNDALHRMHLYPANEHCLGIAEGPAPASDKVWVFGGVIFSDAARVEVRRRLSTRRMGDAQGDLSPGEVNMSRGSRSRCEFSLTRSVELGRNLVALGADMSPIMGFSRAAVPMLSPGGWEELPRCDRSLTVDHQERRTHDLAPALPDLQCSTERRHQMS